MEELNDIQFKILDAVYFVEPFANILEEVEEPKAVLIDELRTLIDRGWIQVMAYDETRGDYQRSPIYDSDHMEDYAYLATKEGLLKHNGF